MSKLTGSKKATQFTESVIREMTRLNDDGGVNLSVGFPDFAMPAAIKDRRAAINADVNQYAATWGARPLREAVAREFTRCMVCRSWPTNRHVPRIHRGDDVDHDGDHRSAMGRHLRALLRELRPDAILSGATPRYVTLHEPDWTFDPTISRRRSTTDEGGHHQHAEQPDGKVFTRRVERSRRCAARRSRSRRNLRAHHLRRPSAHSDGEHRRHGGCTVTLNGLEDLQRDGMARAGRSLRRRPGGDPQGPDFTVAQRRCSRRRAVALGLPEEHFTWRLRPTTAAARRAGRDPRAASLHDGCRWAYSSTDISAFGFADDVEFARYLVRDVGVAAVPGSSFYKSSAAGRTKLRFCFCKRDETLAEADRRMEKLVPAGVTLH
jgi:aminotransferase